MLQSVRRAVAVVVIAFLGLAIVASFRSGADNAAKQDDQPLDLAEQLNPEKKGWQYETEVDEMRGTKTFRANLMADDYNPHITPTLVIWRQEDGTRGIQINGAQGPHSTFLTCPANSRSVAVKIDDGKVRDIACQAGMSVVIDPKLIDLIKGSKRIMIEVGNEYYSTEQFTFTTAGLRLS